jgi:sigma-B regulation protein RsbU (phosphoserine phosphatase)
MHLQFEKEIQLQDSITEYLYKIVHSWSTWLNIFSFSLIPLFFILDYFIMPSELLFRFAIYRLSATVFAIAHFFIVKNLKPGKSSYIHPYLLNIVVSISITLMTVDLGGFNSSYYAGLNLVIIAVNLLLPWGIFHSALNAGITIFIYIFFNLLVLQVFDGRILINNLFFMFSTSIICVGINSVKHKLIVNEFFQRQEIKEARDALWGEMSIAKRIQTALLPLKKNIAGFEVAATMLPATMVGGDYYDIIKNDRGEQWVTIGDVSGHGVEAGLIMMMVQTSITSCVHSSNSMKPSEVFIEVNKVIRKNLLRLNSKKYMTLSIVKIEDEQLIVAGRHQDFVIYREADHKLEIVPAEGTWLGLSDDISEYTNDTVIPVSKNDIIVLYTDGITEAFDDQDELFGDERFHEIILSHGSQSPRELLQTIVSSVNSHQVDQYDDISLVLLKKV